VSTSRRAYFAWVVVCLIWGTTYLAIRIALETMPPLLMAGIRWVTAGVVLIVILKAQGARFPGPPAWSGLAIVGILLLGLGNGGVVWAEQTVPSGLTAVLVAMVPAWTVGIDALWLGGEALDRRKILGLSIGFAGIVLLVWPELRSMSALSRGPGAGDPAGGRGLDFFSGVLATQVACLGWSLGSVQGRRRGLGHARDESVLAGAALQMLFGGLFLLFVGLAMNEAPRFDLNLRTGSALAYLVFVGSIGGFTAYAYALKYLPLAVVSLYAYANPVIAVVLGTLVLNESLGSRIGIAAAVVLGGMALVRRPDDH
jgi:drug/metabolite transporter (DMT)-like permease